MSIFILKVNAQDINLEITEPSGTAYLLGPINKDGLMGENYSSWFTANFENYNPNPNLIEDLKTKLKDYDLLLFMGTWCGDSKQEVPRLHKVLEASNFPMQKLKVIAVSREAHMYKQSPQHEEKGLNIHRVPTLIIYKNGQEINRIVEHPVESFEEDIYKIITTEDYQPRYPLVTEIHSILTKKGLKCFKRKQKKLIKTYKENATSIYALNTYARVLYTSNHVQEAIEIFRLNTQIYPKEAMPYMSLANTLGANGKKEEAIIILENALKILPKHKDLESNLNVIRNN